MPSAFSAVSVSIHCSEKFLTFPAKSSRDACDGFSSLSPFTSKTKVTKILRSDWVYVSKRAWKIGDNCDEPDQGLTAFF